MRKVKITGLPRTQGSGSNKFSEQPIEVNRTLKPVPRDQGNVEVEDKEQIVGDFDGSGMPAKFVASGARHSNGGIPLDLPPESFVFSRDNKMKIKDPAILKMFAMGKKKSGYTPAEIAKKYDINKYRKVLADKNSDQLQRDTAEAMIASYNEKLAKLALSQESMKGFPSGIPKIAEPYMEASGFNPADLFGQQEQPNADMGMAKYGGNIIPEMYRPMMQYGGGLQALAEQQQKKNQHDQMLKEIDNAEYDQLMQQRWDTALNKYKKENAEEDRLNFNSRQESIRKFDANAAKKAKKKAEEEFNYFNKTLEARIKSPLYPFESSEDRSKTIQEDFVKLNMLKQNVDKFNPKQGKPFIPLKQITGFPEQWNPQFSTGDQQIVIDKPSGTTIPVTAVQSINVPKVNKPAKTTQKETYDFTNLKDDELDAKIAELEKQ